MRLTTSQHTFLQLLARATFANPFSKERDELDRQLAGIGPRTDDNELIKKVLSAVDGFLAESNLGSEPANIRFFNNDEQHLLNTALLFRCFHRFRDRFDQHIRAQGADLESTIPLKFSTDLTAELTGFLPSEDQVDRYIGIFFQLRRAWFYIEKNLTGSSPSIKLLRRQLWDNVFSSNMLWYEKYLCMQMESFSTILLGETGTGKGAVAAILGKSQFIPWERQKAQFARNFAHSFESINLAGINETFVESELFGHRKGSFGGAIDHYTGIFGRSSRFGTVFIDEVAEVNASVQVKILRALHERTFFPVGSREPETFRGRMIAATSTDLIQLMAEGTFREDFYYRLSSDLITLPRLQQRLSEDQNEQSILVRRLLGDIFGIENEDLSTRVQEILKRDIPANYTWPGNNREFEQRIRRILLTGACIPERLSAAHPNLPNTHAVPQSAQEVMQHYCRQLYHRLGSYELVARAAGLDRRTVKKYIVD